MNSINKSDRLYMHSYYDSWLDRIGIPYVLRWGFLGILIFMTGNGVEANFIAPHMAMALGNNASFVPTIISMYGIAVIVASYMSGALSDLYGPRRVMLWGFLIWVVFECTFLFGISIKSLPIISISYFLRGFGFPLFAFSFLVWINEVANSSRRATAVGWFYVMFTGGLPTLGTLFAFFSIPAFGRGFVGETGSLWASIVLVSLGFLCARVGVRETRGKYRLATPEKSNRSVILSGLTLTVHEPKILMGFLVRLINTAPEFGMFIILPYIVADEMGWGQSRWLLMSVIIYAGNIGFNAVTGMVGDRWGWVRTVRWWGIVGSAVGLLVWWYSLKIVPVGSVWGYYVVVAAGTLFGILMSGFTSLGAILPELVPEHKGAAMAMYTTAAGGAAFLGAAVVAIVQPWGGNTGVVWTFVALYGAAFVMSYYLDVEQKQGNR